MLFKEKAFGEDTEHKILSKLLKQLKQEDGLYVVIFDCFGRDAEHLTKLVIELNLREIKLNAFNIPTFDEVKNINIQRFLHTLVLEIKKFMSEEERV